MASGGVPVQDASVPLIGSLGTSFVSQQLSENAPGVAIQAIQGKAGLQNPACAPLLGMVDQLKIPRFEAHRGMLLAARHMLLAKVQHQMEDRVKLERLLNVSFKYLGIQELREVPLAVMEKLDKVPPVFLKQLATDKSIFRDLPAKVQRQVWEFDKNLLQQDALGPVGQYKYEVATIMRALAMDEFLPAVIATTPMGPPANGSGPGGKGGTAGAGGGVGGSLLDGDGEDQQGPPLPASYAMAPMARTSSGGRGSGGRGSGGAGMGPGGGVPRAVTRKILRKGSFVVQALKGMVGSSQKIYNQIVELCLVQYLNSNQLYLGHQELSYCTLRAQLLMALHDDNSAVATKDPCHELAWTIDAGIMNGHLSEKHLAKLEHYFAEVEQAEGKAAAAARVGSKRKHVQDEAESAGNVVGSAEEPLRLLGDASIILRDPSAMHLLAAAVLQLSLKGAAEGQLPSTNTQLRFVLRLLQLAVDGRQMLRDRKFRFPDADPRLAQDILPLLGAWALDFETSCVGHKGPAPPCPEGVLAAKDASNQEVPGGYGVPQPVVARACEVLPRSEVARKLVQTFVLERLMRRDFLGVARGCRLLAEALRPKALLEGFDFAGALAQRLADLVKARVLEPTGCLWYWAVDQLLMLTVDAHTQVHEEVLRLLLAAAPKLEPQELGTYLSQALENSRKSRKRMSKKQKEGGGGLYGGYDSLADFPLSLSDIGSDIGSDGWPGIAKLKLHASDGVRSVYTLFARLPKVTSETAPALFTYLQEGEQEKGIAPASGAGAAVADAGATPGGGAGDGDAGQGPGSGAGGAGPSPAMDE